jgi:hypothetical protein
VPVEAQIAGAVQAAPEEMRDGASVYAYDAKGELFMAREGTNPLICLASSPAETSFQAACYHAELEPFMARGRELKKGGLTGDAYRQARYDEVEAGKLKMPRGPRTLHILTGTAFDPKTGAVKDPYRRWVVYIPFATAETTGLSTQPNPNGPWLMFPGTAGAHIMLTPPKPK